MAQIQSPAKIVRLWKKINDRFGPEEEDEDKGKKPSTKAKEAAKKHEKIEQGLTVLKVQAKGGVKTPSKVKKFEKTRDKLTIVMKKYCKMLKGGKLEGIKDQNKFRKAVLQLSVLVEELAPFQITEDEGEEDLSVLQAIDTAKAEKSLDDPNLDKEEDEEFDEGDEGEVVSEKPETDLKPDLAKQKNYEGAAKVWSMAVDQAGKEMESLKKNLQSYGDSIPKNVVPELDVLMKGIPDFSPSLEGLAAAFAKGDPREITSRQAVARSAYQKCVQYLNDPLVKLVKINPFVPVDLQQILGKTLKTVSTTCPEVQ